MTNTKASRPTRDEANVADPSQIRGYDPRTARPDESFRRSMSKGYQPVRSFQIPADRHE